MDYRFLRVISVIVWLSLFGCKAEVTYDYLMSHPELLRKQYASCELNQTMDCQRVRQAASDFTSLLKEREYDPAAFGIKIMQAQERLAGLTLTREKAKKANDAKILQMTNEAYAAEYQKIQEFYAVVREMQVDG